VGYRSIQLPIRCHHFHSTSDSKVQLINGSACQFWFLSYASITMKSANRISFAVSTRRLRTRHIIRQMADCCPSLTVTNLKETTRSIERKSLRMFYFFLWSDARAMLNRRPLLRTESFSSNWYLKIVNFFCKVISTNRDQKLMHGEKFRRDFFADELLECFESSITNLKKAQK
jgi:hypothetical protein